MGKINVARVILGGLLAGLVINISEYVLNIYVVAEESAAIMERTGSNGAPRQMRTLCIQ